MKEQIQFTTPYFKSFRCDRVASLFDIELGQDRVKTIEYDLPPNISDDWQIGAIVGPSGSGKSSVARRHYPDYFYSGSDWDEKPILENFASELSCDDINSVLASVGFASVPCWLRPYSTLSNGEKFRCDLARALLDTDKNLVVFDEFTSVVDRTVAKTASLALRKALSRNKAISFKKFVAVSCHYDIIPWLQPDWILDMRTGDISRVRLRRPKLVVKIYRSEPNAWRIFSQYHYLTSSLLKNARCYLATIDDEPCAFFATCPSMGHKGARRGHRLVILPEFQGIGLGPRLATTIAEYEFATLGIHSFTITTSNALFARALARSGKWKVVERNATGSTKDGKKRYSREATGKGWGKAGRARTTCRYIS